MYISICIVVKPSSSEIRHNLTSTSENNRGCTDEIKENIMVIFSFYFVLDIDILQLFIFMDYKMMLHAYKAE